MEIGNVETKVCTKCGETKAVTEYSKRSSAKDGLQLKCKQCEKIATKYWRSKNKERHSAKVKEWQTKNYDRHLANCKKYKKDRPEYTINQCIKWKQNNPDKFEKTRLYNINKIPAGVYEILYKGIRVYVGQSGKPYSRITQHFNNATIPEPNRSPVSYKLSTGEIKRKDLSFNMLKYIDDEDTRLKVERQYITKSTGLWNSL